MRTFRNLFPPLVIWGLSGGLVWLIISFEELEPIAINDSSASIMSSAEKTLALLPETIAWPAANYDQQLQFVAKRPLFSETRRILEPVSVNELSTVEEEESTSEEEEIVPEVLVPAIIPNFRFLGFIRTGDHIDALLSVKDTTKEIWVSVGDRFLGWTVIGISEQIVKVEQDGFVHVVEISH